MERDEKFEIQFILSLTVVVVALTTANSTDAIATSVGLVFFIIATSHLILLTLYYTIEKITVDDLYITDRIKNWSQATLFLTTSGFIYMIFHIISYTWLRGYANSSCGISRDTVQTIIAFGLPVIPMMGFIGGFIYMVRPPVKTSRDISLNVIPKDQRVYPEFNANDPVLLELLNSGTREYQVTVTVELPENIIAKIDGTEYTDQFSTEITLNNRSPINMELAHIYQERRREIIRVSVSHSHGEIKENIDCFIRP